MKHLEEIDMTYWQHMRVALSISAASFVHAIFPSLYTDYVSKKIKEQTDKRESSWKALAAKKKALDEPTRSKYRSSK